MKAPILIILYYYWFDGYFTCLTQQQLNLQTAKKDEARERRSHFWNIYSRFAAISVIAKCTDTSAFSQPPLPPIFK
jgi:hypothetical protein